MTQFLSQFRTGLYAILAFIATGFISAQELKISAETVVSKSIAFHDPNHQWSTLATTLYVVQETPNKSSRTQKIQIDLPQERFDIRYHQNGHDFHYQLYREKCTVNFDGRAQFSPEEEKEFQLNCDRATMWRNYYTYLYGLPMKLYDSGTHIDPMAEKTTFKGTQYWRVKVTYDAAVGTDIWFFYFHPETYAMEAYQFYKGDPEGQGKNTGEYILLSELGTVQGILMPKIRRWYYNKDDAYLGTDFLYNSDPGK